MNRRLIWRQMMNRHLILGTLLAVVLLGSITATAQVGPESYMVLVSATPIVYEGTPAWEYYYDVHANGWGSASQLRMGGFDATLLLNPLNQRWDSAAADGWGEQIWGEYPSIGSDSGPDEWTLTGNVGAMINPLHLPSEYENVDYAMMYPASIDANNELQYWYGSIDQYKTGLYMTIRLVHPWAPGEINYSVCTWVWDKWRTPIVGPAVASTPTGDFDGDGDVDADDIDILCDNIGGDPGTYDVDQDGDVDEDDMTFMVESLVEWDNGVDTGVGTMQGDFNLDGVVNATDLAIMKGTFGASGIGYADGNANCDTVVNATDLAILKGSFGFVAPTGGGVPEPATLSLLALGAAGLAAKRRRKS